MKEGEISRASAKTIVKKVEGGVQAVVEADKEATIAEKTLKKLWDLSALDGGWKEVTDEDIRVLDKSIDEFNFLFSKTMGDGNGIDLECLKQFVPMVKIGRLYHNFENSTSDLSEAGMSHLQQETNKLSRRALDQMHTVVDNPISSRILNQLSKEEVEELLDSVDYLLNSNIARSLEVGVIFLNRHAGSLRKVAKKQFKSGDGNSISLKIDELIKFTETEEFANNSTGYIESEIMTTGVGYIKGQVLLRPILFGFGLDAEDTLNSWATQSNDLPRIKENYEHIKKIESERPGACKVLQKEFGIRNFNRYPPGLLIDQYDNRDNFDKPYGINIGPYSDHNGTFGGQLKMWKDFYADLGNKGYLFRVVEITGRKDFLEKLEELNKRYGKINKISFVILSAHADPDSLTIGDFEKHPDELEMSVGQIRSFDEMWSRGLFTEDCEIIFNACSAGGVNWRHLLENNVAEAIAEKFRVMSIAPVEQTTLRSLRIENKENNGLKIRPKFWHGKSKTFYPIEQPEL